MERIRFTDAQIVQALQECDAGAKVAALVRRHGEGERVVRSNARMAATLRLALEHAAKAAGFWISRSFGGPKPGAAW